MVSYLERLVTKIPLYFWIQKFVDLPILLKWAKVGKYTTLLEIGCGTGRVAKYLASRLRCKSLIAIDADPKVISDAESNVEGNTRIIFQYADAVKLPFENETFDAVLSLDTLHQIPNWKKAIREIHRVLKKNGKFLLRDYSIESFSMPGIGSLLQKIVKNPYDAMFDQIELLTYIRKNGFEITHQNDTSWLLMLVAVKKAMS